MPLWRLSARSPVMRCPTPWMRPRRFMQRLSVDRRRPESRAMHRSDPRGRCSRSNCWPCSAGGACEDSAWAGNSCQTGPLFPHAKPRQPHVGGTLTPSGCLAGLSCFSAQLQHPLAQRGSTASDPSCMLTAVHPLSRSELLLAWQPQLPKCGTDEQPTETSPLDCSEQPYSLAAESCSRRRGDVPGIRNSFSGRQQGRRGSTAAEAI